ncbi:MAG: hypothetical protein GWM89_09690 [Candidatus Dadabacteria bacterium]|nr:hypothetical protein [Candidatus Dadabacteria bacterium]NIY22673.1 hypothetical protein [Candidatus Dadabacteria bacterium]
MIKINLIPVEERKSVEGLGQFIFGVFIILALIAGMIGIVVVKNKKIESIKEETARVEKRIKELDVIRKKVERFKVNNKKLEQRIKIIARLEKNRVGPLYVMDALSTKIPERAWINGFSTRGSNASITGIASSEFVISEFMRSLVSSPHFRYVNLTKIRNQRVRGEMFKTFGLNVGVNYFKPPEVPDAKSKKADGDTTTIQTSASTSPNEQAGITEGKQFLDKSKSEIKEETDVNDGSNEIEEPDLKNQEKKETKKKPTTGVVGSDDGSNVIVF